MLKGNFKGYVVLSIAFILGLLLRLYKIDNPVADWHSWRQADTSSVSRTYVSEGINLLYPRYHDISSTQTGKFNPEGLRFVELPLYNAVQATLSFSLPAISLEVWGRLVSIFSALISGLALFFIGRKFLGSTGGILAVFFYLVLPFNVYFTRVILPEPMATMFAVTSLWAFILFIDSKNNWKLYVSGVLLALGILVKPFVIFYTLPMMYLLIQKFGVRSIFNKAKLLIPLLIFMDIILIPFISWRAWINNYPEGIPHFLWAFNGDGIRFRPSFWRWIFGERIGHLILGGWGLVPLAFGILKRKKDSYFNIFLFLGCFIFIATIATANVRHDYYQTLIIPSIALLLAQGTLIMWESESFNKWVSSGLLFFSLGIGILTSALQVKEFYKVNHPEIIMAGLAVDSLTPKDALVVAPYNGDSAFLYQTKRWGWPHVDRSIAELIENGADYYVSVNYDAQTREFMSKFESVVENQSYVILDLHKAK